MRSDEGGGAVAAMEVLRLVGYVGEMWSGHKESLKDLIAVTTTTIRSVERVYKL